MSLDLALRHRFPAIALDLAFTAPDSGITVLFGPSGSGKSTVIAAAAGLLRADFCRVAVGGEVLADTARGLFLPPEKRGVGLVFQDARLFPHMSVATNLRYGLRRTAAPPRIGFDEVVDLLGIRALLARRPHTLSGGERQRVAIGRALLRQPRLLLMDEPLASLDAARKAEILPYLARLKRRLDLPVLYVTHSLDELLELADQVVLIEAGRVRATGPAAEIAARADLPLAARDDAASLLACTLAAQEPERGLTRLDWNGTPLWLPALPGAPGQAVRLKVPAREVVLARAEAAPLLGALSLHNVLAGQVIAVVPQPGGRAVLVEIAVGEGRLLARVTPDAVQRLALGAGIEILGLVKSMSLEMSA